MSAPAIPWRWVPSAFAALVCALALRPDALPQVEGRLASLPRITLWAWEQRTDLHALDTSCFAVAYLDRMLTAGVRVQSQMRRNPVVFPAAAARIPVIRIETEPGALLNETNRDEIVRELLAAAHEPGIAALQIDFDATRSERKFYRDLLVALREQMPPGLPLSITALASWCSYDDWLRGLPVDEAVPMMFRMEPDRRRAPPNVDDFRIRDPLCQSSTGVSTTEAWPSHLEGKRIYIFPDHGWQTDALADLERRLR